MSIQVSDVDVKETLYFFNPTHISLALAGGQSATPLPNPPDLTRVDRKGAERQEPL